MILVAASIFHLWQEVQVPVKGEVIVRGKLGLPLEFNREVDCYVVG